MAGLFGSAANRFDCEHCFRAVAVPVWQRKVVWGWTLGVPLVLAAAVYNLGIFWSLAAFGLTPLIPFVWARWWGRVVRPEDVTMAKPRRRHSRKNRRKQKLL